MATTRHHARSETLRRTLGIAVCLVVVGLLGLRAITERASARRAVGVYFEEADGGLLVVDVVPGDPAERGGLRVDDLLVGLAGRQVATEHDYDAAIHAVGRGETIAVDIERAGRLERLTLQPGIPVDWWAQALAGFTAFFHLALAGLVLASTSRGRRVDLLLVLLWAIAIELALPLELIGAPRLQMAIGPLFWLLTGLQFGIELNLAALIPARHRWLDRAPWAPRLFYLTGLGYGATMAASEIPALTDSGWMAWTLTSGGELFLEGWYLLWPLGVCALLLRAALGWADRVGRNQALLVLLGVVPWVVLGIAMAVRAFLGLPFSPRLASVEPLVLLLYPLAIFVALYRYHLFDFQLVVRKGLLYSVLLGALLLIFYGALGGAGAFLSTFVDDAATSVWVVGGATLVLGLLFAPLRRVLETLIEKRVFPERLALRSRLARLARDLPRQGSLAAICDTLVAELREIFALRGVAICLSEGESALVLHRASSPERIFGAACQALSLTDEDPLMQTLSARLRPVALTTGANSSDLAARLSATGVALVQPITSADRLLGLLLVGAKSEGADLPAEEAELLDLFSHHVATILENVRLFESARIDGLTGLLRREALLERLDGELDRALRYGRPLTVAMLDLDDFKRINDRHGHMLGDLTLKRVSAMLAKGLRKTDAVGRYGGDEFLLLLPETTPEGAARLCAELRRTVSGVEITAEGRAPERITVSIGLAALHPGVGSPRASAEALLAAADTALYSAKRAGGDQVRLAAAYSGISQPGRAGSPA